MPHAPGRKGRHRPRPESGHAIEELAGRDDEFRSLCGDLADAEAALMRCRCLGGPMRFCRIAYALVAVSLWSGPVLAQRETCAAAAQTGGAPRDVDMFTCLQIAPGRRQPQPAEMQWT